MFRNALIASSLFLTAAAAFACWLCLQGEHTPLAKHSPPRAARPPLTKHCSNVRKDVWTTQGSERVHLQITANASRLVVEERGNEIALQETFSQVACRCETATQTLSIRANEGVFSVQDKIPALAFSGAASCTTENGLCALADTLVYAPQTRTLTLASKAPNRVLVSQQSMKLSAPEVEIEFRPPNTLAAVRGKGDVHGSFNPAEESLVRDLLAKVLP